MLRNLIDHLLPFLRDGPRAWTRGRLASAVFTSALGGVCVILLLAAMFLAVVAQERDTDRMRDATLHALRITDRVAADLAAMESAHRAYITAGRADSLASFHRRRALLDFRLDEVARTAVKSPSEFAELARIRSGLDQWVRRIALPQIAVREAGGDPSSLSQTNPGVSGIEKTRFDLERFGAEKAGAFGEAQMRAARVRLWQTGAFMVLAIMAIAFFVISTRRAVRVVGQHVRRVESAEADTRLIIASTVDAVLTTDAAGIVTMANPSAGQMFGAGADRITGRHISELLPQRAFAEPLSRLGARTVSADGRRLDSHASFPAEISVSHAEIAGTLRYVAVVRDVTERHRNEADLRRIGLGVSSVTGEAFVKSFVSELCHVLQLDCAFLVELEGKSRGGRHTVTLAERGVVRGIGECDLSGTACEETLRSGFSARLAGARDAHPGDWMLSNAQAESFVAMPLRDDSGAYIGIIGVLDRKPMEQLERVEGTLRIFAARAASELHRKRHERDLAEEKDRLAVTLRSIGDGCVAIDNDGVILLMNPAAESLTGWRQEDALGRRFSDVFSIIDERTRRPCRKALRTIIETGSNPDVLGAAIVISREETERVIETNATPIRDQAGEKIGVVLAFRDITDRHRIVEERQKAEKLESLGVAAGGIAHDFNNLLTAILGNLSLTLSEPDLDPETAGRLNTAKNAGLRAQGLAQQLLTFAKGGAPIKQTASMAQLVRETVGFSLRGSNVRSEIDIPGDLWNADVDAGQISQVIQNLAINADQAMPAGGTVQVACSNFELRTANARLGLAPGRYLRISVQDEGIGIPDANLNKIFDPYFTTKPKGSGLGLATAYSIMKSHGGLIDVVSRAGEGTCFHLFLPASDAPAATVDADADAASADAAPASPAEEAPDALPDHRGARVLVLDDEEVICALVSCALEPLGFEVVEALDAASAIRAYAEALENGRRFDVVISDLTIPGGMGGREAVKRLRELDPSVKAIVSSGYAMDPVMSAYREHGFCAMIAKPYEIDALGKIVSAVLSAPPPDCEPAEEASEEPDALQGEKVA